MSTGEKRPAVSIIVPVYNAARWVGACVTAALGQTFQDFELILVEDGSTDDTAKVLEAFRGDPRVRVLSQANQGLSVARNAGLGAARGGADLFPGRR